MNSKKVMAAIIVAFLVVGGTTGFLIHYFLNKDNVQVFPPCVEKPFTSYPANMTKISTISS